MTKRDFLDTADWSREAIDAVLALARRVKRGELLGGLERKVLALVFMDPSLRTRASFETAMFLHGGHAFVLEPGRGSWSFETEVGAVMEGIGVEHIIDAARVLGRYADAVAVRSFPRGIDWASEREDRVIHNFARYCEKPVINMESVRRHPCQGLADALTLQERFDDPRGKKFVLQWAWHPKALPTAVPASAALAAAHLGMAVTLAHPEGFELDPEDLAAIQSLAEAQGGSLSVSHEREAALADADAVYVKAWGALSLHSRPDQERSLRMPHRAWRMTEEALAGTRGGRGIVLHCLPVRRNVEIDDAVLDGPNSAVYDQAENRLHVQRALLLELLSATG
ncbi:MAG TPA: N-acetylornithine carbamoyltransferase [Gemmatimonadales bacterium]|jgi:N-acetylornithine carbamoyltransferase|nr:N-acetylornithine carbamoyltransferase [Gemmatimonadales bacterium]